MSKEKGKTQNKKRKLTRQEKKQIDALIRQSKGDGKPHTAQDSIPFERMYKDGICRLANGRYSKCIEFEDINYQLAQPDDKTAIFEALCDMYNSFDASISVQLSLDVYKRQARGRPLCHALGNPATLCRVASASASGKLRSSARLLKNGSAVWSVSNAERHRACKTAISMTTPLPTTTAKTH